jgi:protein-tyrosine phosphatase
MMTPNESAAPGRVTADHPPFRQGARILRDRISKRAFLETRFSGPWRVYASLDPTRFDQSQPLLEGEGVGYFPLPVTAEARRYFLFYRGESAEVLADELLPMHGGYNFRDLGGIAVADGRVTAWDKLIRSDALHHLEEEDVRYLESLPLRAVVDFRTTDATERSPDRLPPSVRKHVLLPLSPGSMSPDDRDKDHDPSIWSAFMMDVNRQLVLHEECIDTYRQFFAELRQPENQPLLFHCAAGKDRTGLAAAYILFSLGASIETVMDNYLASNIYLRGKYDHLLEKKPQLAPLFSVREAYLRSAIEAMRQRSGSVEAYLTDVLKVDLAEMRELFLQ